MEDDVWNQDTHTRHQVKVAIAKLAQSCGFQVAHQQPLNCLADLMERYVDAIGRRTQQFAEHSSHYEGGDFAIFDE